MARLADDRYIVISSDCHAGAPMLDYRAVPRGEVARRVRRVGGGVREPIRRSSEPTGLSQLGLRSSYAGARGRRRRRRGALPQHDPTLLSDRPAGNAPADHPRRLRPPVRRDPGAQPLARRLLRRAARPPCRHRPDLPLRRRRRGGGGQAGAGSESLRRASCSRAWRPIQAFHLSMRPTTSRSGTCAKTSTCRSTTTPARRHPTSGGIRRHPPCSSSS